MPRDAARIGANGLGKAIITTQRYLGITLLVKINVEIEIVYTSGQNNVEIEIVYTSDQTMLQSK